jgi:CRP-like cAMP-binding protein
LAKIGPGKFFGELALLTDEPRSATIRADLGDLLCLKMTRSAFQDLFSSEKTSAVVNRNSNLRERRAWEVFSNLPLFSAMTEAEVRNLVQEMNVVEYLSGTCIIQQGREGSSFYIILEGLCKVTIEDEGQTAVNELGEDDYFGEVSLLSTQQLRSASVFSITPVVCFTLDRDLFLRCHSPFLLKELHRQPYFNALDSFGTFSRRASAGLINSAHAFAGEGALRRLRGSVKMRCGRILRSLVQSLSISMITAIYRNLCYQPKSLIQCGPLVATAFLSCGDRETFHRRVRVVLDKVSKKKNRGFAELSLIRALWEQSSTAMANHCLGWPDAAMLELSRYIKIDFYDAGTIIQKAGGRATTARMVVRGTVTLIAANEDVLDVLQPGASMQCKRGDHPRPSNGTLEVPLSRRRSA